MTYKGNKINFQMISNYKNDNLNEFSSNYLFEGKSENNKRLNKNLITEIEGRKNYISNNFGNGNLTYQSIFTEKEKTNLNNNIHRSNKSYNRKGYIKKIKEYNEVVPQEKHNMNMNLRAKKKIQNNRTQNRFQTIIDISKKNKISQEYIPTLTINGFDNDLYGNLGYQQYFSNNNERLNMDEINKMNKKTLDEYKGLKYQKSEERMDKIMNKNDFMKNIKKINDLNLFDENGENFDYFSTKEKINNIKLNENDYLNLGNKKYEMDVDGEDKNSLIKKTKTINEEINKIKFNNFMKEISNNKHLNSFNLSNEAMNIKKDQFDNSNLNNEQINSINKMHENHKSIGFNLKSHSKLNNYLGKNQYNSGENIISNRDNEAKVIKNVRANYNKLKSNNNRVNDIDKIIQRNIKNYDNNYRSNKIEKSINELSKSIGSNSNYILTNSHNFDKKDILDSKGKNKQIAHDSNNKNNYLTIIKKYKEKIDYLMKENKRLNDMVKKSQALLAKYKNEIINFRKKENNLNNKDFRENNVYINYNYDLNNHVNNNDNTKEKMIILEKQNEAYKLEIKNLKKLIEINNDNNKKILRENLINKFNTSGIIHDEIEFEKKRSYSVSKSKKTLPNSFLSSKTFQEDETDSKIN